MLLESMKMEIPVFTEVAGVVRAVKVSSGDVVQDGDVLVEIGEPSWEQRGRDSNPRLTSLPATAFKAVPIGHSGTPPCHAETARSSVGAGRGRLRAYSEPPSSISTSS